MNGISAGTLPEAKSTARWPPDNVDIARLSIPDLGVGPIEHDASREVHAGRRDKRTAFERALVRSRRCGGAVSRPAETRSPGSYDRGVSTTGAGLCIAWAPGRVNLIGEHTDYSGGLVLPVAIQRGISLEVTGVAEDVALVSQRFGAAAPFAADGSGEAAGGWGRYAHAVAAELDLLGRPPVGLTGTVSSDLPAGAGLSSSAALEVAVGLALCAVADFELDALELALACQRAELRAVGVPCGILDQAASLLGRAGNAILLDCGTLEHRLVPLPAEAALVVVDSGVEHSHETSGYASRRQELEAGMPARVRHVQTENQRVRDFAAALEAGDLAAAGLLLLESHASLRDDYEVSIPELDLLVELAREAGAYGARLLGGGFGGAILALTEVDRADALAADLSSAYRERTGREGVSLVAVASAGAAVRR
jgi:galactokinase